MAKAYLDSWKKAKADFEKATGKKKPDPKSRFGKLFTKINPTGLEKSLKNYDAAKTLKTAEKSARAFQSAANAYLPTLDAAAKAARDEKDEIYADACAELAMKLSKIAQKIVLALDRFEGVPKNVDGYFKSPYWFKMLKKQAKLEYSTENIELYDLIVKRKLGSEKAAQDAFDTYLSTTAPKEVNISSTLQKACIKLAKDGKCKDIDWDAVRAEVGTNLCDTVARLTNAVAADEL